MGPRGCRYCIPANVRVGVGVGVSHGIPSIFTRYNELLPYTAIRTVYTDGDIQTVVGMPTENAPGHPNDNLLYIDPHLVKLGLLVAVIDLSGHVHVPEMLRGGPGHGVLIVH